MNKTNRHTLNIYICTVYENIYHLYGSSLNSQLMANVKFKVTRKLWKTLDFMIYDGRFQNDSWLWCDIGYHGNQLIIHLEVFIVIQAKQSMEPYVCIMIITFWIIGTWYSIVCILFIYMGRVTCKCVPCWK